MGVLFHACNGGTQEAEEGDFCHTEASLITQWVLGQPGLHNKTGFQKTKQKTPKINELSKLKNG